MYAIVKAGGRQMKVAQGDVVRVDRRDGEVGSTIFFDEVLLIGGGARPHIGFPTLPGVRLEAEILEQGKAKKVIIFKKKRRKNYRRKRGFRAQYTLVRIGRFHGHEEDGARA